MANKTLPKGHVPLIALSAVALRDRMASGALTAEEVAQAFLDQIAASDPEIEAWAWLDSDYVLDQARKLDVQRRTGRAVGALHGLPVALKDVIDTARIPTENGTVLDQGRVPSNDATIVARLRAAGAVIMGKTVTAELAFMHPGKTRNPVNGVHTPGGSSSGSAAAVAAHMVPLAVGTQTGGSIIRPAAYCGCVGFKPTFGAIPRTGVLSQSPSLDTMGVFARDVTDAALLAEVLYGHDPRDPATRPTAPPRLSEVASDEPPVAPTFAFLRPADYENADPDMRDAMAELVDHLGERCFEAELPPMFNEAVAIRERINYAEMSKCFYAYEHRGHDLLSEEMRAALVAGQNISARDYIAALDWADVLYAGLEEVFSRCDAILTPAAPGAAPHGLESTGSSAFNALWTLCRTPAVTVPLLENSAGLPMGVQLVARRDDDARLLRSARALSQSLS